MNDNKITISSGQGVIPDRRYSLDERRENVNKNGGAGKLPDALPWMMDMADIYRYGKRGRKVIEKGCIKNIYDN